MMVIILVQFLSKIDSKSGVLIERLFNEICAAVRVLHSLW
jgi:hypothetical protein